MNPDSDCHPQKVYLVSVNKNGHFSKALSICNIQIREVTIKPSLYM